MGKFVQNFANVVPILVSSSGLKFDGIWCLGIIIRCSDISFSFAVPPNIPLSWHLNRMYLKLLCYLVKRYVIDEGFFVNLGIWLRDISWQPDYLSKGCLQCLSLYKDFRLGKNYMYQIVVKLCKGSTPYTLGSETILLFKKNGLGFR